MSNGESSDDLQQRPGAAVVHAALDGEGALAHLRQQHWLLASGLSYADFRMATFLPFNDIARLPLGEHPALQAWYGRLMALPGWANPFAGLNAPELPPVPDKVTMLSQSLNTLQEAGYVYIGMDHFALPDDSLAVAKRQGRLHRNFQGYSTYSDCDLIGLGVSSIGKVGATYSQNAKTMEEYCDALDHGQLPVNRGLALSRDDLARRAVIMALMCQGQVLFESIELAWLLDFREYFASELDAMRDLADKGLVTLDDAGIQVTPMGWYFVRAVAMVFDRYLQADRNRAKFSRII